MHLKSFRIAAAYAAHVWAFELIKWVRIYIFFVNRTSRQKSMNKFNAFVCVRVSSKKFQMFLIGIWGEVWEINGAINTLYYHFLYKNFGIIWWPSLFV